LPSLPLKGYILKLVNPKALNGHSFGQNAVNPITKGFIFEGKVVASISYYLYSDFSKLVSFSEQFLNFADLNFIN